MLTPSRMLQNQRRSGDPTSRTHTRHLQLSAFNYKQISMLDNLDWALHEPTSVLGMGFMKACLHVKPQSFQLL